MHFFATRLNRAFTLILTTLAVALAVAVGSGQADPDLREGLADSGAFIKRIFREKVGEFPKLGWLIPGQFLTERRSATAFVYPRSGAPFSATYKSTIPAAQQHAGALARVACDHDDKDPLYAYSVAAGKGKGQVFYTTKPWPGNVVTGRIMVPLSDEQKASISALLKWTVAQRVQRHEAVAARVGSFYFSFHQRYDVVSGVIREAATVLHEPNGQMFVIRHVTLSEDTLCDGCAMEYLKDKAPITADVLNVFELGGFPYPVLLLDSSTVEGRAITFQTVGPDRKIDDFRLYEYVVNCAGDRRTSPHSQLGPDLVDALSRRPVGHRPTDLLRFGRFRSDSC